MEWKDIPGYEGQYQISDKGEVRSLDRVDALGHKRKGQIKAQSVSPAGYKQVHLCKGGKWQTKRVHRLVAEAFMGELPRGMHTCHSDGDKANNHLSNLRYDTPRGNAADTKNHGSNYVGETHRSAKLTADEVREIRALKGVLSQSRIGAMFGLSQSSVGDIHRRITWGHLQ